MNSSSSKPQLKLSLHVETLRLLKQTPGKSSTDPMPTEFPPCAPVTAFL